MKQPAENLSGDPGFRLGLIGWNEETEKLMALLGRIQPDLASAATLFNSGVAQVGENVPRSMPSLETLFGENNLIFISASSQEVEPLLPMIRLAISDRHMVVLLGRHWSMPLMQEHLKDRKLIRLLLQPLHSREEALVIYFPSPLLVAEDQARFAALFQSLTMVLALGEESRFEAAQALVGFAPAAFFSMMEALADAALMSGLPRGAALDLIASLLRQTSESLLEGKTSPDVLREASLRDELAAEGLLELESAGMRGLIMRAFRKGLQSLNRGSARNLK